MKNKILSILKTLRIFDEQNALSITNLSIMLIMVKIAMAPQIDWPTMGTLLVLLFNYIHKRNANNSAEPTPPAPIDPEKIKAELKAAFAEEIEEIRTKLSKVNFLKIAGR